MLLYFTGTGNSRYCAEMLAQLLEDTAVDAFPWIREGCGAAFVSEKPWVFVTPTYGWQIPRVFQDFIRKSRFSGNQNAYFVMTCGQDTGNAAAANEALCREKALRCRGTLPVVMPENYIALFQAPEAPEAQKIISAARPVLEAGAAAIRAGHNFLIQPVSLADRLKSGPVNNAFYRFVIKSRAFAVSDRCIGCGKCENACVLQNIHLQDGKPRWGSHCTHCMACICGCPVSAIEYGKASRGKPRYQCPKYEG